MVATLARRDFAGDIRCNAATSGTIVVGMRTSGSSAIASVDGEANSMRAGPSPAANPTTSATTRSTRPRMVNHTAPGPTMPRRMRRATNGVASPIAISPRPAGNANTAGNFA